MISQSSAATSHPNEPNQFGTYAALLIVLAALPPEQLQHLELVFGVAHSIGNLVRMHLGER
ncbi:hypothetical protein SAMN05216511_7336 [Streptomyces sp. KS_16]|uniref:hypothetical protein n=1 Tax=unclassified Streptomyces TaxID=2593676 RepID=UPI000889A49F|nr:MULTISPECIES: hypothetical protein [unclassified Streptomyces]PBC72283.1 hypothetical protein BX261_7367 [Streptomyces sp. 2321.6]SDR62308.1 hypothetical protein SAMN05216511_7336 [Streptomyces sp. KS_16]SNC77787.1 hypothetical protein SAMN06272741_7203 [Streptomyces sp. 2114.4]